MTSYAAIPLDDMGPNAGFEARCDSPAGSDMSGRKIIPLVEKPAWHQTAILTLNQVGKKLEKVMPNGCLQNGLDNFYTRAIEPIINSSLIQEFSNYVKPEESESFGIIIKKLPSRVLRNLVVVLYGIIQVPIRLAVHPLKTSIEILQFLVILAHALTLPETWTGLGAGFIGAAVGQALFAPGPQVLLALMIGSAFILFGLALGAYQAARRAEEGQCLKEIGEQLKHQFKEMPEAFVTGFFVGVLLGNLEMIIDPESPVAQLANLLDDVGSLSGSLNNLMAANLAVPS